VSSEASGNGLDVTLREFVSGQKLFNRYRLVKTLGRGGMGVVWLARDEELERDVALKFLPELIIHDRAVLGDLKRETRRSLELTHKNIVRIYDFIHDETSGCISMEYVDGDTLSNLRADKPHKIFEPEELADWVSQLCDALDYAHGHARIVHRDLKPANLMVNQRSDLKVADFGIARSLSDSVSKLTMQHGKSGTLVYMSPQQLEGERGTPLDDIYSIGASVYELLTSKPPFYSGNVDRQIREKIPPRMTDRRKELEIEGDPIDEAWEEVVRRCLAKDPAKRPQSVTDVAKQLEVPSPKTRRAARATSKQSRRVVFALTAIAVALIIGAGGWLLFRAYGKVAGQRAISRPPSMATAQPVVAKKPETAPPVQSAGPVVELSSVPSGARVLQNGMLIGTTPVRRDNLPPGEATFLFTSDGYLPREINARIDSKEGFKQETSLIRPAPEYAGSIRVRNDRNSPPRPVAFTLSSDVKSGTMMQSSSRGDFVVKFNGVWEGTELHAVTGDVVSQPPGIRWEPESFTLRFADDGKTGSYECVADGKTYVAELSARSSRVARARPVYKGTIHPNNVPLTISLETDRKSGTMTQTSKHGDVVVKFNGVWNGMELHAATNEVISKPENIKWDPESFTLRFSDDWKTALYECNADGQLYSAELSAP
jgi:serine/threonine protein kinase